jgi:hypothetical protein
MCFANLHTSNDKVRHASGSVLLVLCSVPATNAIATYSSQIIGATFAAYSLTTIALLTSVFIFLVIFSGLPAQLRSFVSDAEDRKNGMLLLLLCLAGGLLALFAFRPDADDFYYLPNARYFIENPGSELSLVIHYLYSNEIEFQSLSWATSTPYELFCAALDHVLGIDYLFSYYYINSFFAGSLIPLALFYLARQFVECDRAAIVGTAVAIGVAMMLFDTHRTFGNFSFVRAFQGKTFVLSVCIPALAGATLGFFSHPSPIRWLLVFVIATAGLGASASSVVLLPLLALVVALSFWVESRDSLPVFARKALAFGSAFIILITYAVVYKLYFADNLGLDSPANTSWPTTFSGQLRLFGGDQVSLTASVVTLTSIVAPFCLHHRERTILLAWMLSAALLFLNPVSAPVLIKYFTGPNIYWRLFYLLPFPLAVVVIWNHVDLHFSRYAFFRKVVSRLLVGIMIALCLAILAYRGVVRWIPQYKIPEREARVARLVVDMAPGGPMLAPQPLSGLIGIFSSRHPQIAVREDAVATWLGSRGKLQEARLRIKAASFAGQGDSADWSAFEHVVKNYPLASIIMSTRSYRSIPDYLSFISQHHLCSNAISTGYVMLYRGPDCHGMGAR